MSAVSTPTVDELIAAVPSFNSALMAALRQRHVFDQDDIQDLQQQTYLTVIEKIRTGGLAEPDKLKGYIYMTAWHLSTAYWSRRRKHRARFVEDFEEAEEELVRRLPDPGESPVELVARDERARHVRHAMDRLGARDRDVLRRIYIEDEDRRAVSKDMAITEKYLNTLVWRAKPRLSHLAAGVQP